MDEQDIDALGLLTGLRGQARTERARLIMWLLEKGFDLDQISGTYSPIFLPPNRVTGDDGTSVSARELSASSGVDLELLQRLHRAAGLVHVEDPEAAVLSRADAESVLGIARLADLGFDVEQLVLLARLLMEGFTGAAVSMRQAALQAVLHPGATELELAQAFEGLAHEVKPLLGPMITDLFKVALRHSFETEAINAVERAAGCLPGAREVGIAFADLVGFTALGEQLPPEDLVLIAGRLANLTHEVVRAPVQFVKAIGDAVMLVCADPAQLLTTMLDLVEATKISEFPPLRVGLAFGPAIGRAGDWYGSPVNLASRVTEVAPSGMVLATESARNAIGECVGIEWSIGQARQLKGVPGVVRVFSAHRVPNSR